MAHEKNSKEMMIDRHRRLESENMTLHEPVELDFPKLGKAFIQA